MPQLIDLIKPSNIDTSNRFWGSGFCKSESETVAYCLTMWLKKKGDTFNQWFYYDDVKKTIVQRYHLDSLSEWLESDGAGRMRVTNEFVRIVCKFMKDD